MVKTYGLSHVNLAVRDCERALRFYREVFGVEEYARGEGLLHAKTPGAHDVITFAEGAPDVGKTGGVAHIGFRLVSPEDIDEAVESALRAGGTLLRRGEFRPGLPYAYVADPDGYEVEVWFE